MIRLIKESDVSGGSGAIIAQKGIEVLEPYREELESQKDNISEEEYNKWTKQFNKSEDWFTQHANDFSKFLPNAYIDPKDVFLIMGYKCDAYDIDTWARNVSPRGFVNSYILVDKDGYTLQAFKRNGTWKIEFTHPPYKEYDSRRFVRFTSQQDAEKFIRTYNLSGLKPERVWKVNKPSRNLYKSSHGGIFQLGYETPVNQDGLSFMIDGINDLKPLSYKVEVVDEREIKDTEIPKKKRGPGFRSSVINKIVRKYNTESPDMEDAGDEYANSRYTFEIGDFTLDLTRYEKGPLSNRAKNSIEIYIDKDGEEVYDDLLYLDEYDSAEEQFADCLRIVDEYIK